MTDPRSILDQLEDVALADIAARPAREWDEPYLNHDGSHNRKLCTCRTCDPTICVCDTPAPPERGGDLSILCGRCKRPVLDLITNQGGTR